MAASSDHGPVRCSILIPVIAALAVSCAPGLTEPGAPDGGELRQARGVIHQIGSSDICETDRDVIQGMSTWRIGECRAVVFRLVPVRGAAVELVDLVLRIDDEDAIADEHIPFGLIDPLEHGIVPSEGDPPAQGTVSYERVRTRQGMVNVVRSFRPVA
jgi:hypothetical protein